MGEERLQKILSSCGICSRRKAEEYLSAGRVRVNGVTAKVGDRADPDRDRVEVDGSPVSPVFSYTYLMLNKPRGFVTTVTDEKGRKTVMQLVQDCPARVWPVGRLDLNSEGLLFLTNDGDLTYCLTHPSHEVEKEYYVEVYGEIPPALPLLRSPMEIGGERMEADEVRLIGERTLDLVIHQGKNRQIRKMCGAAGLQVRRLVRVREDGVLLGDLPTGQWRSLTEEEISSLKRREEKPASQGAGSIRRGEL